MLNIYFETVCWFTEDYIDILEKVRNIHILVEIAIIEDFKDKDSIESVRDRITHVNIHVLLFIYFFFLNSTLFIKVKVYFNKYSSDIKPNCAPWW